MNALTEKLKEVLFSVLPITIIVLILHFTIAPLDTAVVIRFLIGALLVIIGLTVFLIGVDHGITPVGSLMGSSLTKTNRIWIIVCVGLVLGFFVSIAEPDLHILANQVNDVTSGVISKTSIVVFVSAGIAVMLAIGLIRIVYNIPLYKMMTAIYVLIFCMALFTSPEFLAISFDASGATTGALTVPFILAVALGVSSMKKDSKASESDSFGLVGVVSTGAIIAVMMMNIIKKTDKITGTLESSIFQSTSLIMPFIKELLTYAGESFIALLPLFILFMIFNKLSFKLHKKAFQRIAIGFLYALIGLALFLTGVNAGFMDVGSAVGSTLSALDNKLPIVIVGFILGLVTVLAEPAVYVLTHQIEDVTSGYVKRKAVMFALSIGVGFAVALSMIRIIIPEVRLWHYLLPGYIISIALAFFTPQLFAGIAFDSGGVASGPMTATFILAFANGAADAIESADVMADGFGMIAMVALTPIITLQILGLIFKIKSAKGGRAL